MKLSPISSLFCLALASLVFAQPSMADDVSKDHRTSTTSDGTTVTKEISREASVSDSGERTSSTDESVKIDPKGLLNKSTSDTRTTVKTSPDGDYSKTRTTKNLDGTSEVVTAEKETSAHWTNDGKTTTTTEKRVIDPVGLGNKRTVEIKKEIETNPHGEQKTTVTKKIDGATVSEESKATY